MSMTQSVLMTVNGESVTATIPVRKHLVDFLREDVGLTGSHIGCEHGVCGACTLEVNGSMVRGCLMLAVQADGGEVTTVEGLAESGRSDALRAALCSAQRIAMWLLHAGHAGECLGVCGGRRHCRSRCDPSAFVWQLLSVHGVINPLWTRSAMSLRGGRARDGTSDAFRQTELLHRQDRAPPGCPAVGRGSRALCR